MPDDSPNALPQSLASAYYPSLDLVYDLARQRLAGQMEQIDKLDSKAGLVLGSASIITAGVTALHANAASFRSTDLLNILAVLSVLFYLGVVGSAYQAYKVRAYEQVPALPDLQDRYAAMDPKDTKAYIFTTTVAAHEQNKRRINAKVRWTKRALLALFLEAGVVAALTLVQAIH